jgi:hypothetical protein
MRASANVASAEIGVGLLTTMNGGEVSIAAEPEVTAWSVVENGTTSGLLRRCPV